MDNQARVSLGRRNRTETHTIITHNTEYKKMSNTVSSKSKADELMFATD